MSSEPKWTPPQTVAERIAEALYPFIRGVENDDISFEMAKRLPRYQRLAEKAVVMADAALSAALKLATEG